MRGRCFMKKAAVVSKSAVCAFALAGMVLFAGCGGGGGKSALIGYWICVDESSNEMDMELFSDGTAAYKKEALNLSLAGEWSIVDKRFVSSTSVAGVTTRSTYDYKISGYELTLVNDKGEATLFVKKEKLEEYREKQVKQAIEQLDKNFVSVQGGTFTMGCTQEQDNECQSDEKPAHSVTVGNFQIGKYEITQGLWKAIMGNNPSKITGDDNLPVGYISWDTVQVFIKMLNAKTGKKYRLPTEAEWEYAARGGNKSTGYTYSGSDNIDDVAWYKGNSDSKTHPVGTKQANELGIYDMTGNVWEWVSDWYGNYNSDAQNNPTGPSTGSIRVGRGGCWYNSAQYCRVFLRGEFKPTDRLGFRLVLAP